MSKNKDTHFNGRVAIGFILYGISDFNYEPIRDFIDNLDIKIEAVKLKFGFGFAHKKIYLDLLEIYNKDVWGGHFTLYILLYEVGHILRIREDEDLVERLNNDDFDVFFNDILIEEEAAHEYAVKQFKLLTGVEVNQDFLKSRLDINTDRFRNQSEQVFARKKMFGSWDAFIESIIDRDYVFRVNDLSWNTDFTKEERHIRACINGDYYNPFDIPDDRDLILFNPFTFVGIRANGESMNDYNEKDVMMMNPFNSHYTRKASFENGKVVEAYEIVDDEWESIDLETL